MHTNMIEFSRVLENQLALTDNDIWLKNTVKAFGPKVKELLADIKTISATGRTR